jgi:sialic acid synthase SpsE
MKKSHEFLRSLFIVKDKKRNLYRRKCPFNKTSYGLPPKYLQDVLGKRTTQDIKKGTPLKLQLID